jgi:hypothetical protein
MTCCDFRGTVKFPVYGQKAITSSPLITNNRIFFGSVDSTFYALDAKNGVGRSGGLEWVKDLCHLPARRMVYFSLDPQMETSTVLMVPMDAKSGGSRQIHQVSVRQ